MKRLHAFAVLSLGLFCSGMDVAQEEPAYCSAAENLDRLYITVPVIEGAVSNPELLRDFLAASHDLGLVSLGVVFGHRPTWH